MGEFSCVRIWQLKAEATPADLENLATSSLLEMQRWIPGVKRFALFRIAYTADDATRYSMNLTFASHEAYKYWLQMEEEALDYWERYAAVLTRWEQLCFLVAEYAGELIVDASLG
ncbi:hypothetical protein EPA93_40220 [Ktedonosporobacter rubrisoli]|uniref:ABM domain-containing protein n=1 Tax=Ktedonosporobacter rubrisoli TaxID=2509675 RepID=A0A4P6K1W7_KTERU|nr:hypothetical protein [Ktedonosporobacter rubrisoli]QBD81872.1 hypothetical protein EPA93_40220 [Ktedonosporobacter rubrisoli]